MAEPLIGIISQVRMTSTRLPGKVLLPMGGKTVLEHHVARLSKSSLPVFLATTVNATDNPIVEFAQKFNLGIYRGDEQNVLSRYYGCAQENKLDIIIRVTSDCPLIDGQIIQEAAEQYISFDNPNIYLSNCLQRTFPRGLDFEIFSFQLLEEAFKKAQRPAELEHVTPYINQNCSGQVSFKHIMLNQDKSHYRITLDTLEDFNLLKVLIEQYEAHLLPAADIIKILDEHPELVRINQQVEQKPL